MKNNLKTIKLNALFKKQESEELRNKWKLLTEEDPIEKELALSKYINSKNEYLDLIQQIQDFKE
tara:strand:- start:516 stop:707 length:192 start_codon:yes stop_codon:yes gene_type:complete